MCDAKIDTALHEMNKVFEDFVHNISEAGHAQHEGHVVQGPQHRQDHIEAQEHGELQPEQVFKKPKIEESWKFQVISAFTDNNKQRMKKKNTTKSYDHTTPPKKKKQTSSSQFWLPCVQSKNRVVAERLQIP